jgi:hypothetical protein
MDMTVSYTLIVLPVVSVRSTAADTHEVIMLAAVNIRSTAAEYNWRYLCGTHQVTVFAVVKMTYLAL